MTTELKRDLDRYGITEEQWALILAGKMSASGKCMSGKATADGGRCWCCRPYGHAGRHKNPHVDEHWAGDTVDEQFAEEVDRIAKL